MIKRLSYVLVLFTMAAGAYWAFQPRPIAVDTAVIDVGPMQITIREDGVTRVRDVYTISSHIAGRLDRIVLEEGQAVAANETIVAEIHPISPPLLDERTQLELQSAVDASQSAVDLAIAEKERAETAQTLAQSEYDRARILAEKKLLPLSQLEKLFNALELAKAQVRKSEAAIVLQRAELVRAKTRLMQTEEFAPHRADGNCCIKIRAPVDGVVLKLLAQSEQTVTTGTPLMEIGDTSDLEIVVDLLSRDAALVKKGAQVVLSDWGAEDQLTGSVRRVDPAGFTKTSSLGIEEQRVNVVVDPRGVPASLKHGYRIVADFVIWQSEAVTRVPIGALFRSNAGWAVFVFDDGVARLRPLAIDKMNDSHAQVVNGLEKNDRVILYPSDILSDGKLVEIR